MALPWTGNWRTFFEFLGHQWDWPTYGSRSPRTTGLHQGTLWQRNYVFRRRAFQSTENSGEQRTVFTIRPHRRVRREINYPLAWLNSDSFAAAKVKEEDGERESAKP